MPRLQFHYSQLAQRLNRSSEDISEPFAAATLGEAIAVAEKLLRARLAPHDEGKWFRIYLEEWPPEKFGLIDIHIEREDGTTCPKQDVHFQLLDSDIIAFTAPLC